MDYLSKGKVHIILKLIFPQLAFPSYNEEGRSWLLPQQIRQDLRLQQSVLERRWG